MSAARIALACFVLLHAANPGLAAAADERSPGDMTDAEREAIVMQTSAYDGCLRKQAAEIIKSMPDARAIADESVRRCEPTLGEMDKSLGAAGFSAEFRTALLKSTRERGARRLLPEVMEIKASGAQ